MKSAPDRALSKRGRRHFIYAGMAAMLGVLAGYSGVLPVFRSHLLEYLGVGDRGFGLLFSVGSIVGLVGTLFGGVMIDKWGPRRAIRITLVGLSISLLPGITGGTIIVLAILSRSYLVTSIGYILAGLIWSAEFPVFVSTVMRQDKQRFGAVMAVSGLFGGVAMFVAMNWMGALMERIGDEHMWKGMLAPAAGFILVGLIGWVWSRLYGEH